MRKMTKAFKALAVLPVLLLLFSCNPIENDSKSNSLLLVVKITALDIEENETNFLQSDVVKIDETTGAPYVTDDSAVVTFTAKTLDPAPILGTSHYSAITVNRYVVTYFRSDGKNQEGVDVPYSFEGAMSALVDVGAETDATVIVVRAVSKLEPPLIEMREGRGEGQLKVTAKIDFYGEDTLGNAVKATGYLSIFFANYITEQSESGGGN